ncbi:MAG: PAS domain S-box protein [Oryzomonas sp.]
MPFNTSLKAKISLIFTLLGMTILISIAALTYHYSHAELKKSITAQQTALVNTIAQQLDDRLELIHEQFKRFAVLNTKLLDNPRELQRQLNKEEDLRVYFNAGMLVIDRSGKILAEYPFHPERIGTTIPRDREYFQETLTGKKPYISSPYKDTLSQEPVIAFTVPILNSDGTLRAILVGRQKLWTNKFLGGLADARIGRTGYFVIFDKYRNLVIHPDKNRIYERIKPGSNQGLELTLKGFEGTLENATSRGVKSLSSYKHLKAAPWILATSYPINEAYEPLNTAVLYFLLILVGACVISALIIRYTMQRITAPLIKLTEHVVTIDAKQGKDRLVHIESRDEIGKLAQVFNTMIQKIDEHQDKIGEEKSFIESLVTNSAAPIFVLDGDHRIIYWNKALEKLSGYKVDDMKGTTRQWEVFYQEQRPTMADVVLDHAQGALPNLYDNYRPSRLVEGAFQAEGWYHLGNTGRHFYLRFNAAPIRNAAGEIVGAVETFEDATDTKRIEERLNDQFRFLQEIIDTIPNPIFYKDRLGRYIGSNRAFEEFIGRPKKDIFGKTICDLIPGEYAKEHFRMSRECISSALPQTYESFLERTDNSLRRIIVTKAPYFDKKGKPAGLVGSFTDITERHALEEKRKLAEQSLAESKAELEVKHAELGELFKWVEAAKVEWEQTLDSLRDMVILTDPTGKVRRCNRLLYQLANKSYDQIIGIDWPDILTEAGFTFSVMNKTSGEVVHKSSNRFYNLYIYDITSPGADTVTGRVMSLVDTTELRSVTEELQKAYDELQTTQIKVFQQEKLASIGQLAAGVAHEINNPMGFISSNLTTMGKYFERTKEFVADSGRAGVDEQRKRLKIDYIFDDSPQLIAESLDGAQRVRKIVQDLKSFSRVDDTEQKRADLKECLESTIGIAWNEIKYVATLKKDYGDIPPVLCYPQQLNQVFMNLLVNAAHAITGQGEIRVRTWQDGGEVCISVSDTGCGISEENQKRIFEPFFTTKEVGKGTGLGLSISYDIIKKHHGDIQVDSEIGTGTTFTVRIPINGVPG